MGEDLADVDWLQVNPRRAGQTEKALHDALQPVQFAVDDLQTRGQLLAHLGASEARSSSSNWTWMSSELSGLRTSCASRPRSRASKSRFSAAANCDASWPKAFAKMVSTGPQHSEPQATSPASVTPERTPHGGRRPLPATRSMVRNC